MSWKEQVGINDFLLVPLDSNAVWAGGCSAVFAGTSLNGFVNQEMSKRRFNNYEFLGCFIACGAL
ncbi:MAG TPA: hypothetical protein DEF45_15865 [Rhodopirellula sp.]|nr:MAG: hypothetical protein CBD74_13080 [Saprospirales bacterium TMED214]HBV64486.1 hypothetical protein [Rhodopirellula sp.]